jgi:hypothetical protein
MPMPPLPEMHWREGKWAFAGYSIGNAKSLGQRGGPEKVRSKKKARHFLMKLSIMVW